MAGPQVITGLEPSGGSGFCAAGWTFIDDKIFGTLPKGTLATVDRSGWNALQILGYDIFGSQSIDDIYNAAVQGGYEVIYISRWRNAPTCPVGTDSYIGIAIYRS